MISAKTAPHVIETWIENGRPSLLEGVVPASGVNDWAHYPARDARDAQSRSRWYFHRHSASAYEAGGHGHFHLFLHRTQLPGWVEPEAGPPAGEKCKAPVAHVAALSVDAAGAPQRWFTTNRFVTNEFLFPAPTMIAHLPGFNVEHTGKGAFIGSFLTAMVTLYREEIASLLHERDERQAALATRLGRAAYERESGVEVLSQAAIDIEAKLCAAAFA